LFFLLAHLFPQLCLAQRFSYVCWRLGNQMILNGNFERKILGCYFGTHEDHFLWHWVAIGLGFLGRMERRDWEREWMEMMEDWKGWNRKLVFSLICLWREVEVDHEEVKFSEDCQCHWAGFKPITLQFCCSFTAVLITSAKSSDNKSSFIHANLATIFPQPSHSTSVTSIISAHSSVHRFYVNPLRTWKIGDQFQLHPHFHLTERLRKTIVLVTKKIFHLFPTKINLSEWVS
jgi:hypothetical protein